MSMDKRFHADDEWFVSQVMDLSAFSKIAATTNRKVAATCGMVGRAMDSIIKFEDDAQAEMDSEIVELMVKITGCEKATAEKIISEDLNLDRLRGDDGRNEYDDDSTVYSERNPLERVSAQCSLRTIQNARKRNEQAKQPQRKSNYLQELKYYRYDYAVPLERRFLNSIDAACASDFVMTCSTPVPNNKIVTPDDIRGSRVLRPAVKFIVRGETELADFRRKLICPCDVHVDMREDEWLKPPDISNKSHAVLYPSAFIFIHDTFYTDTSGSDIAIDISAPIRAFMEKHPASFGSTKMRPIDGVKFKDLKLRLGQPYVMVHSGECEHLLIFHDVRLLSPFDEQDLSKYPLVAHEKGGDIFCIGCKRMMAAIVVEDCLLLPQTPSFFCKACFKEFFFNADGKPVAEFKANHYYPLTKLIV